MFADDTRISYSADSPEQLQNDMSSKLKKFNDWISKLSLNIPQTDFMTVGLRQRVNVNQNNNMSISIDHHEINRVYSVIFSANIDSHLTWSVHIETVCSKILSAIGTLKRIR